MTPVEAQDARDFLDDDRVGNVIEASAAFGFGDGDSCEAEFGGFVEEFVRKLAGLVVFAGERLHFGFREFANAFLEELLIFGQLRDSPGFSGERQASRQLLCVEVR